MCGTKFENPCSRWSSYTVQWKHDKFGLYVFVICVFISWQLFYLSAIEKDLARTLLLSSEYASRIVEQAHKAWRKKFLRRGPLYTKSYAVFTSIVFFFLGNAHFNSTVFGDCYKVAKLSLLPVKFLLWMLRVWFHISAAVGHQVSVFVFLFSRGVSRCIENDLCKVLARRQMFLRREAVLEHDMRFEHYLHPPNSVGGWNNGAYNHKDGRKTCNLQILSLLAADNRWHSFHLFLWVSLSASSVWLGLCTNSPVKVDWFAGSVWFLRRVLITSSMLPWANKYFLLYLYSHSCCIQLLYRNMLVNNFHLLVLSSG